MRFTAHGVSRPAPFALNENRRSRRRAQSFGGDVVPIRTDDDRDVALPGLADSREHVGEHRTAGDVMQRLRPVRSHANALAGGENHVEAASGVSAHGSAPVRTSVSSAKSGRSGARIAVVRVIAEVARRF